MNSPYPRPLASMIYAYEACQTAQVTLENLATDREITDLPDELMQVVQDGLRELALTVAEYRKNGF